MRRAAKTLWGQLAVGALCMAAIAHPKAVGPPKGAGGGGQDPKAESIKRGAMIYEELCVTCHLPSGEGVVGAFPPLAGSDYLLGNRMASIRAVKYGQKGEIVVNGQAYNGVMADQGLMDEEVADVMNYILNTWGNKTDKMVTNEEVAAVEK